MTYLDALDRELKDLAPDERADLLDEPRGGAREPQAADSPKASIALIRLSASSAATL